MRRKRGAGTGRKLTSSSSPSAPLIDEAMLAIEWDNPSRKGVLPPDYAREDPDKRWLGDLIGTIALDDQASRSQDVLAQVERILKFTWGS